MERCTGGSWVVSSPAIADGRVYFATSDSALYQVVEAATGKRLQEQQTKAYVFSSPTIAGDVVLVGVLNGTLQARDKASGALLWEFQTDASRANRGWVLTATDASTIPCCSHRVGAKALRSVPSGK